ncbi:MAG: hypothetical protein M3Y35_11160 [Actinomycetota bacterium]|nr:hypothetical protein [Actinomycetota bacterium]
MPTDEPQLPGTLKRSPKKVQRAYEQTLDSAEEQYARRGASSSHGLGIGQEHRREMRRPLGAEGRAGSVRSAVDAAFRSKAGG